MHTTTSRNLPITRLVALFAALAVAITLFAASTANAGVSQRTTYVKSGDYRTLATLWNTNAGAAFQCPAGAKIRVLYGYGWFSKSRQEQTLNCQTEKRLSVGKWSLLAARMQIKVPQSGYVNWAYLTEGPV